MPLTARDVVEILRTLDELGYQRFRFEQGDVRLEVDVTSDGANPAPVQTGTTPSTKSPKPASQTDIKPEPAETPAATTVPPREGLVSVDSPMTGTFYRAPSPDVPPFVEVGSTVEANDTVCLVDVMKLFTSIPAGAAGTVAEIRAQNEAQVEAGQVLMWIEPAS